MRTRTIVFVALACAATMGIVQLVAQTRGGREDCVPYNPSTLRLIDEGQLGWLISRDDGASFMVMDTKDDADVMMGVFRAHSAFCYVGRDNKRANHREYVQAYWK